MFFDMFFAIFYRIMFLLLSSAIWPFIIWPISSASSPTIPHFKLDLLAILYCFVSPPESGVLHSAFWIVWLSPLCSFGNGWKKSTVLLSNSQLILEVRIKTKTFYWPFCQWVHPIWLETNVGNFCIIHSTVANSTSLWNIHISIIVNCCA